MGIRLLRRRTVAVVAMLGGQAALLRWAPPSSTASGVRRAVAATLSPATGNDSGAVLAVGHVIAGCSALGAELALAWLLLGTALLLGRDLPGATGALASMLTRRVLPRGIRKALETALALTVAGTVLPSLAGTAAFAAGTMPAAPPAVAMTVSDVGPVRAPVVAATPALAVPDLAVLDLAAPDVPAPPARSGPPPLTVHVRTARLPDLSLPDLPAPTAGSPRPHATARSTPGAAPAPHADSASRADPTRPGAVTVRPGDTLWAVAARSLGPHPTATQIAAAWPRWWAANRALLGTRPDLLLPGMVLTPPA